MHFQAYDPSYQWLITLINEIKTETIEQGTVIKIFENYTDFKTVKNDLNHACSNLGEVIGNGITAVTYEKLEVILSDLRGAFDCLDSITKTLEVDIRKWKEVEKLRIMVCSFI